ncbi:MAG: hypothetical protein ABI443_07830 [Chthoniobacterales bacterium]
MKIPFKITAIACIASSLLCGSPLKSAPAADKAQPFVAFQPGANFTLPPIVLQYDAATKSGANWEEVKHPTVNERTGPALVGRGVNFLRDGLKRMTGKEFPVVSTNDLSKGIVLTLLKDAPEEIRKDAQVQRALKPDPKDHYAAVEAFYIRSEKNRVLIVANTAEGLTDAVASLLESVNYEVLGMGVDWIHVPDHRNKPLIFSLNFSDRPSFYVRQLWAHSGQCGGRGTIAEGLTDPADEIDDTSYWRWLIGTQLWGKSMDLFPGHALQAYHDAIIKKMRETGSTEGFLSPNGVGMEAQRPAAGPNTTGLCWFNTDPKGTPGFEKIYYCDGKEWKEMRHFGGVDVSAPIAREVIFDDMKKKSEEEFKTNPDMPFIFPMDTEDGENTEEERAKNTAHANWFPEYLAKEKMPFGRPYALNGFKGINQPKEIWEPYSATDNIYALASYLLHEYDKWIDSLPKDQQFTSTGKSKKELIRCSLQSYNYHDVPPNFNPDLRLRVSVAPFPKHRGIGKWEGITNQNETAQALHIMLPLEPSANYAFYSNSWYADGGADGIPATWSASPKAIADTYHRYYEIGFRSISYEMDCNFGKYGIGYYLAAKMLWNVRLTAKDLDAIRDRWLQRSFGSAWPEMKVYYDFMLPENYPVNTASTWAKAIRLLDAADKKLDGTKEPDAQRRLDDLKQIWYVHYLFDSGKYTKNAPEVKEFLWKGQMSYIVGMYGLMMREYNKNTNVRAVVGPEISAGPAHYTHAETQAWWPKVLDFWKILPVQLFADATLANGKPAKTVDVNDLVAVQNFQSSVSDAPFVYNSGYMEYGTFLMTAVQKGDLIGFKLVWPSTRENSDALQKKVPYNVEIWDPAHKAWKPWLNKATTSQRSIEISTATGQKLQLVDVQLKAPGPGVYRFILGAGGNGAALYNPTYNPVTGKYEKPIGFTYYNRADGLTQSGVYIYIPKGTKNFDLDMWAPNTVKTLTLFTGLPDKNMTISRKIDVGATGLHSTPLQPGESGSFALIEGNNFRFPFLYSVPMLWAKSPSALLVPRAIAEADGLTIIGSKK